MCVHISVYNCTTQYSTQPQMESQSSLYIFHFPEEEGSIVNISVLAEIIWEECPQNDLFCVEWDINQIVSQTTVSAYGQG